MKATKLFVLLVALVALALAGCDDDTSIESTDTAETSDTTQEDGAGDTLQEDSCQGTQCADLTPEDLSPDNVPECIGFGRCQEHLYFACVDGVESAPEDCSLLGDGAFCTSDGCEASCVEDEVVCQGGLAGHPYLCSEGALTQSDTCDAGEHCLDGSCVVDLCEGGAAFCQNGDPYLCDDAGSTSSQIDTCDDGERCENGACVGETPPPEGPCLQISQDIQDQTGATLTVSPGDPGFVIHNGSSTTLRNVISGAAEGTTILLEDGTYTFQEAGSGSYTGLYITTPNLTIRSVSGNPDAVILDSNYMSHGGGSGVITVAAAGITIADITVMRSIYHLVHLWNGGDDVHLHNLKLIDGGQQFVKTSPGNGNRITGGQVSCSSFEMTPDGRNNVWGYGASDGWARCYTGGIDTHDTDHWVVNDNHFEGIYCDDTIPHPAHGKDRDGVEHATYVGGLAEHAIHMWDGDEHILERNTIVNCARGIGLGLGEGPRIDGGVVRNNMIVSEHASSSEHDVGIILEGAPNVRVLNNSVVYTHDQGYSNGIEYRFNTTQGVEITNNLTNRQIRQRNDAQGSVSNNFTEAQLSDFVNPNIGDLHLVDCGLAQVNDQGASHAEVQVDFDSQPRSATPDLGADECISE